MSVFIAIEPIILDRQISGLSNWAPESHWKRHWKRPGENKSVIVRTYKAERPSSNSEKGEMVRWWQYDMKVKPSQHGANIRPRAETGLPAPQPPVPGEGQPGYEAQHRQTQLLRMAGALCAWGQVTLTKRNLQRGFTAEACIKHSESHPK